MNAMAKLDTDKLRNLIGEVEECIRELEDISKKGEEELLSDRHQYAIAEHYFRRALEGILTIGTHIISRFPTKTKDYQEIILTLGKLKIVPQDFARKNKALASYRNRLVHVYWEVAPEELFQTIRSHLSDLGDFCRYFTEVARNPNKFGLKTKGNRD